MTQKYKYIKIVKNSRIILRIKLQEIPKRYNSHEGEVDIFIDAARNRYFDVACLQTIIGRVKCGQPINSVSWHGFYDERGGKIKLPVINFKDNQEKIWCPRHTGVIKKANVFLFPICSIYIPTDMKVDSAPMMIDDSKSYFIKVNELRNARVDFFVLPKNITFLQFFSNLSISLFYFKADITIFDKSNNGSFLPLPVKAEEDIEFKPIKINGWDTLIRIIYADTTREIELCGKYSVLLHDPNNAINMLLERKIGYPEDDGRVIMEDLRIRHEAEVDKLKLV